MSEEESSSSQWAWSENENIYIVNWIRFIVVVVCWKETFKLRSFSSFFSLFFRQLDLIMLLFGLLVLIIEWRSIERIFIIIFSNDVN